MLSIFFTLDVSNDDRSRDLIDEHSLNIYCISTTEEVSNEDTSREVKEEHAMNIEFM